MLNDIIQFSQDFQPSVNIDYDFNNSEKITGFIPTSSALEIITNIIINTFDENRERAKIFTGAYGRGKSHIILVALSILYNKDKAIFKKLLKKIKKTNYNAYQVISNYIESKKRMLPVIINGNSGSLTQAFLGALQQALHNYGLEEIMPESHFLAAVETIKRWKKDYPKTYKAFVESIDGDAKGFINQLSANSISAYERFVEIYPNLTSGSVFNPFVGFDVVYVYNKVNDALANKGYSGIYVVYDEFGKYLESSMKNATESDMKMLQDFAEMCARSSKQQMHLMLICHKEIENYIDENLPKFKADGWRGISGRYDHISLSDDFDQVYEIIAHSIIKRNNEWEDYVNLHRAEFDEVISICSAQKYITGMEKTVVLGCYPLHPVTTYILPRLSEMIAQNERTLFTFLSANQKNTLRSFVKENTEDFPLVTPDCLYDYFEKEIKKELRSSDTYKMYKTASRILVNFDVNSLSAKIIKTIAVLFFIHQEHATPSSIDIIMSIYCMQYDMKTISATIDELINNKFVVYLKNITNCLALKEASGVDIYSEISNRSVKLKHSMDLDKAVAYCASNNYLYPIRHNETYCLTRYFNVIFINYASFLEKKQVVCKEGAAGVVYAVLVNSEEDFEHLADKVRNLSKSSVVIVPKRMTMIEKTVYDYISARQLEDECSDEDSILRNEYNLLAEDYGNTVKNFIADYLRPERKASDYYYGGQKQNIIRKSQLSELLSVICDCCFPYTPIINNEVINKDTISSIAVNSRGKLISAILESDDLTHNLGLNGSSQEVSFFRSTLVRTNIIHNGKNSLVWDTSNAESSVQYILNIIKEFFSDTAQNGEKSFSDLYNALTKPQYGIGMKKGSIPVYIAVVLRDLKDKLVFKCNGDEIKISADTLNSINEKPEVYSVTVENWDSDKANYLSTMSNIFTEHFSERDSACNNFANVTNCISRWYLSLPKCAKEMTAYYDSKKPLSPEYIKFISSLKGQIVNPRQFLMEFIPSCFKKEKSYSDYTKHILSIKHILDNAKHTLICEILKKISVLFGKGSKASISSMLTDWYASLSEQTLQNLFPNNENAILEIIRTVTNDEETFAQRIGKAVIGLRVDDWNMSLLQRFCDSISDFKKTVDEYNTLEHFNGIGEGKYKIITVDAEGNEIIKSFDKVEYSKRARLLYQDITASIDEMGQAISEQEKRQILMDILQSLC